VANPSEPVPASAAPSHLRRVSIMPAPFDQNAALHRAGVTDR